jgi:hypothetical protein
MCGWSGGGIACSGLSCFAQPDSPVAIISTGKIDQIPYEFLITYSNPRSRSSCPS